MVARPFVVASLLLLTASPLAAQGGQSPPSVRWSGYIQARETYQDEVGLTGSVNRARLSAAGSVAGNVSWRVQGEFRTGSAGRSASVSLQDAYVRWARKALGIQVGQFKTPFTREFITSLTEVETADRAFVVDTLARLTGDDHPIHYDDAYAAKTRFGKRLAHGLLLLSMTALGATPLSRRLEDSMIAFAEQRCRFLKPVFVGDIVTSSFEVASVDRKPGRDSALVRFNTRLLNGAGEAVLEGEHAYFLRCRGSSAAAGHTNAA